MRPSVKAKGALGPGQMLAVDMKKGKLYPRYRDQGQAGPRPALW